MRKSGLAMVLAGALVSASGCMGTLNDSDYAGAGVNILANQARTPGEALLLGVGGALLTEDGRRQHEMRVAQAGRSQVNVNVGSQGYQQMQQPENVILRQGLYYPAPGYMWANPSNPAAAGLRVIPKPQQETPQNPVALTCNAWVDANGDRRVDINEFVGIKKVFGRSEQIEVMCRLNNPQSLNLEMDVMNLGEGKIMYRLHNMAPANTTQRMTFVPNKLQKGDYRVIFNLGYTQAIADFKVIE